MYMAHLLLVEPDAELAQHVADYLEQQGHEVRIDDGRAALERTLTEAPELVLTEVALPEQSGFGLCRAARDAGYQGPIVFLTERQATFDEALAFELGADDFVRKPPDLRVLALRIAASLRRRRAVDNWREGALEIDPRTRTARFDERAIPLTTGQFDLLWLLARNAGSPVSREAYFRQIRGIAYDGVDRSYDSRVRELRVRLQQAGCPELIKTVRGVGYQLTPS